MNIEHMHVSCFCPMEAKEESRGWIVNTNCYIGIGKGMYPKDLMERCVRCPIKRRYLAKQKKLREAKENDC